MKRAGFTMIELIFVIVILGILAAVAVPKLAATRDDANVAKGATQLATLVSDLGAFYTASGGFDTTFSNMSNVPVSDNTADLNATATTITLDGADCITIQATGTDGTSGGTSAINILYTGAGATSLCSSIVSASGPLFGEAVNFDTATITDANLTHTFGGSRVTF